MKINNFMFGQLQEEKFNTQFKGTQSWSWRTFYSVKLHWSALSELGRILNTVDFSPPSCSLMDSDQREGPIERNNTELLNSFNQDRTRAKMSVIQDS